MDAAVERIFKPSISAERIVLFGDYDVDGVTSLALLAEMLRAYGAAPELFLPLRMEEGYGLSRESVERCWRTASPAAFDRGRLRHLLARRNGGAETARRGRHHPGSSRTESTLCPTASRW